MDETPHLRQTSSGQPWGGTKSRRTLDDEDEEEEQARVDLGRIHEMQPHYTSQVTHSNDAAAATTTTAESAEGTDSVENPAHASLPDESVSSHAATNASNRTPSSLPPSASNPNHRFESTGVIDVAIQRAEESMRNFQQQNHHNPQRVLRPQELSPLPCQCGPLSPTLDRYTSRKGLGIRNLTGASAASLTSPLRRSSSTALSLASSSPTVTYVQGQRAEANARTRSKAGDGMLVQCEQCRIELWVYRTAVVFVCPDCDAVSPVQPC